MRTKKHVRDYANSPDTEALRLGGVQRFLQGRRGFLSLLLAIGAHVAALLLLWATPAADRTVDLEPISVMLGVAPGGFSTPRFEPASSGRPPAAEATPGKASDAEQEPDPAPDVALEAFPAEVTAPEESLEADAPTTESVALAMLAADPDLRADPEDVGQAAPLGANSSAAAAGGTKCDLAPALQKALQDNEEVREALARIPRRARSVANAMMLWDGGWVEPGGLRDGGSALEPVRRAVLAGVRAAQPECRTQIVSGPRFLSIDEAAGKTVLAMGSGQWRWSDLLNHTSRH